MIQKSLASPSSRVFYHITFSIHIPSMLKLDQCLRLLLVIVFLQAFRIFGQTPDNMPLRQVISEAQKLIGEGDFAGASPFLDELEIRFQDEKDPEVEKILQQFGFVRGVGYLQSFAKNGDQDFLAKAAKAFGFFAEQFPNDPKAVSAMQKRTDCLRALHEWKMAASVIETLLDENQPYKKQIIKRSELLSLYHGRAQCYHIMQDWVRGESAFQSLLKFADFAKDEDRGAYAVSCLTEMYVQNKRIDEVFPLLPRLSGDTPARYDLRLNVNLMQGAELLTKAERHVDASLLYSLTMTTEEIITYYSSREERLQTELSRLEQFLAIQGSRLPQRRLEVLKEKVNGLAMQLTNSKGQLNLAKNTPSFTTTLRWRKADNFQTTSRDWESFWGFYWLYKDFPDHESVENFLYAAFASANKVSFRERSIELGEEYLANKNWVKFRPDVTFIMTNAYREEAVNLQRIASTYQTALTTVERKKGDDAKQRSSEYYDRFFDLCDDFLEVMPEHKYARDFVGMMGSVYFKRKKFDDLLRKFAGYENGVMNPSEGYVNREAFRKSPAMSTAHYMSGLALLATGKFDEAKPLLGAVVGVSVKGLPLTDGSLAQNEED